jgi:imidazolonepropionase-like amidohydrolase
MIRILEEKGIPVIVEADVRPNGHGMPVESTDMNERKERMKNIPLMIKQGLRVALTTTHEKYLPDLFWIVQYFQKYGISFEEIIKTITINPAKIFRIDNRIGSLAKGKDADILFFKRETGMPLPVLKKVMSEGHVVYEEK